jgi:dihydroorotate dehydrogenase (NAD+) catalytic subunit
MFATDCGLIDETVRLCRGNTERLLVVKLSPNVGEMRPFAAAARDAGADAVTIANTFNALDIDVQTRRSRFHRPSAGYSGPGVRPIVLYHVWQVHTALPELPIFGSGGIVDTDSALQYLLAGASVLLIGSGIFKNPGLPAEIQQGLTEYLDAHGVASVQDLVGTFDPSLSG